MSDIVLLAPLPYPHEQRLVDVFNQYPTSGLEYAGSSIPDYLDRKEQASVLEDLALYTGASLNLAASAAAPQVKSQPGYYRLSVGSFEVTALSDGILRLEPTKLLQGRTPTMRATAELLATGVPALRDRLGAEGHTFRALLDETRRDLAREHLRRGMGASEVAYLLGFSEPAGFQHACRRWFGVAAGAVHRLSAPTPSATAEQIES